MNFTPSKVHQFFWTYLFLGQQALFPVVYAAGSLFTFASEQPELIRYLIKKGDTLDSVSRQFGVVPHQLLTLNRHLKLDAPYLVVGETINVPRPQTLPILASENPLYLKENTESHINVEQKVAQHVTRLGQALTALEEGREAGFENESEIVKGARRAQRNSIAASGEQVPTSASRYGSEQEVQYWRQQLATQFEEEANAYAASLLGAMGTARTRVTLDDDFNMVTAEADLLLPLAEEQQTLLFTQFGLRRNGQDRTIANLGVGQRHFLDRWMLGYNLFADYDLTNRHWRAGVGAEAWRDYLKLGANFYTPLSSWRDSPRFEGMEERAARGMDVRLEAYLPAYPQWSASLTAEQYLGERVGLLDADQLERDPHAITAGLHYNPFPLLKMDVEQVEASGRQHDTRFTLGLEWKLGATLWDMLNPSSVDKSLAGMRHDLIERNNDMVLEYRDKVLLKASLNDQYFAAEGQALTLTLNIQHSRQIASIQWLGDVLGLSGLSPADTAGQDKRALTLPSLPTYRIGQSNQYPVVAIVTDIDGHEAIAEGVVAVSEDSGLQPAIQLAEHFVQLLPGAHYQVDWGVVDPRQKPAKSRNGIPIESIEGDVEADRDGYQYRYRLTFQGPAQVLTGRELVAPGQPNPGTRYRLDVEVIFPSGHVARDSMEFEFIDDATVPVAPTLTATDSNGDDKPEVTGKAEPESTVTITWPDGTTSTTAADVDGNYTLEAPTVQGSGTITATATDKNGNTGPATSVNYTDSTAPGAPTLAATDRNSDNKPEVSGKAEPESTVTITWPDGSTSTTTADVDGNYSLEAPTVQGSGTITATATDKSGNTGPASSVNYLASLMGVTITGLVNGFPQVGSVLTAVPDCGSSACSTGMTWQWQIEEGVGTGDFVDIDGATSVTYLPAREDQKKRVRVIVAAL
ncbi:inverse autotransporter beta domain-containing protein [Aeromonas hydrophila]|uniref:inverse autotransporter beta domain-containing protein n=1 Tax=Aeromonas hydrophila TaxID=644 RepID=UPI001C5BA70B|nr:inverse autotransporter beta domain-containing protein [Aeromonas hydrophila]MBW3831257.1 LysM peptidoglycan-binding domain-containing protein [Aeromonas hydrophila]MBW5265537.1 LysM peptidoglycan-binding domain-containing protein [Aeromonas hydrophila]MBW5276280.1 LysM peptidoglycan-binding domain-containing protein [Aeromonas hydrophila]